MKYCYNCGKQLADEVKFCFSCGAAVPPPVGQVAGKKKRRSYDNEELKKGVMLCDDGKYRWIYPFSMWTNPTILFLVYKIFFWIFVGFFLLIMLLSWSTIPWGDAERLWDETWPVLVFVGVFAVIIFLGYAIVAGMYGGKYIIIFTMDEHGINHEQIPEQAKKARKLGAMTAAAGAAGGSLSTMGLGMSVAARTSMYTKFASVRSVKRGKWGNVIKLREILSNNQVYVRDEDYEFVYNYIIEHCPQVKKH